MAAAPATATAHRASSSVPPPRRRLRLVVAGSLAAGAVAALALVLVVVLAGVAGAREHAVTGSALLGLAAGWALLAVLSARLTDRPQRWALVPAGLLGAAGVGLLVLAPGDAGLTAAGWVWPPLLLVLAGWTAVRVRRSLGRGDGRRLLYPVVAVMALAAAGGAVETAALAALRAADAPGRTVDVGGHALHLDCAGSGSPTVVLLSGLGETSASWRRVVDGVAPGTRVCAHDRAGQGWSDDLPEPQGGPAAAADLHALLDRAGEDGPFVLVGHSSGGAYALVHAARYPAEVAGVVLLDATDPYRAGGHGTGGQPPPELAVLPSLARLGVGQLLPAAAWSGLPGPAAAQHKAFASSPRGWRNTADEATVLPAVLAEAGALPTLGGTPLAVLTAAAAPVDPGRAAAQDRLAALSTAASHRLVDATHAGLLDEERGAAASVAAVADVVRAVRTGTPLPPG